VQFNEKKLVRSTGHGFAKKKKKKKANGSLITNSANNLTETVEPLTKPSEMSKKKGEGMNQLKGEKNHPARNQKRLKHRTGPIKPPIPFIRKAV